MVAVAPAIHAGFVIIAEPPHGMFTRELLPFAVTLNDPNPLVPFPVAQFRVILTPPEVAAVTVCGALITNAPAMTEISPTFSACIAPFMPGRRLFSTYLVIALVLRTLRNSPAGRAAGAGLGATGSATRRFD